jgi:hypothetical protein
MPAPVTLGFLTLNARRTRALLRCWPCERRAYYAMGELASVYGEHTLWDEIVSRAKCSVCNRRVNGDTVTLELELGPIPQSEAIENIWGGYGARK